MRSLGDDDARGEGLSYKEKLRLYLQKKLRILTGDDSLTVLDTDSLRFQFAIEGKTLVADYQENRGNARMALAMEEVKKVFAAMRRGKPYISFSIGSDTQFNLETKIGGVDGGDGAYSQDDAFSDFVEIAEKLDNIIFQKALSEASPAK